MGQTLDVYLAQLKCCALAGIAALVAYLLGLDLTDALIIGIIIILSMIAVSVGSAADGSGGHQRFHVEISESAVMQENQQILKDIKEILEEIRKQPSSSREGC